MSATKKTPEPVSWETITRVANQAEADRLERMTPEQLDAELRAMGIDPREADLALERAIAAVDAAKKGPR
ncbi:MAG: hypothetical protein ACRELB_04635 [Polyangiaceae bacterium]